MKAGALRVSQPLTPDRVVASDAILHSYDLYGFQHSGGIFSNVSGTGQTDSFFF
jgi:hypothetical protein